jgi:D-glycerate 3-kinase
LSLLSSHPPSSKPFTIGLNGVQGAGKTTLVSALAQTLQSTGLETLVLSIDDLYLTHQDQVALASANADNKLVQHRGEPGTHDMALARSVFGKLLRGEETKVPEYDKSAFNGQGDRVPPEGWRSVNKPGESKIQVIILEGWCVGFRSLPTSAIDAAYSSPSITLHKHTLSHLLFVNEKLAEYDVLNNAFDAFIHIDAQEIGYVYAWRQEQEAALRQEKGRGMSEEEVVRFVDGYYPAYELYTEPLRRGVLNDPGKEAKGRQLRLVVGRDRKVVQVVEI